MVLHSDHALPGPFSRPKPQRQGCPLQTFLVPQIWLTMVCSGGNTPRETNRKPNNGLSPKPVIYTMALPVGLTCCPDLNKAPKSADNPYRDILDQTLETKPQEAASSNLSKSSLSLLSGVS